jgi:hypothetical protein
LDFGFSEDFANRSWVEIIEEEEKRKEELLKSIALNEVPPDHEEKVEIVSSQPNEALESPQEDQYSNVNSTPNTTDSNILPNPKEEWADPRMVNFKFKFLNQLMHLRDGAAM